MQMPGATQAFNRYSYCLNNPLIYTDPSGELAWWIPVAIFSAAGAGYMGYESSGTCEFWQWEGEDWTAAGIGAIAGAGLGLGVSAGLSAAGVDVTGIYASKLWGYNLSLGYCI